jgi:hypothetical protein
MWNQASHSPWISGLPTGWEWESWVDSSQREYAHLVLSTLIQATPEERAQLDADGAVIRAALEWPPWRPKIIPTQAEKIVESHWVFEEIPVDPKFLEVFRGWARVREPDTEVDLEATTIWDIQDFEYALSIGKPPSEELWDSKESEPINEPSSTTTNPEVVEEHPAPNVYFWRAQALGSEYLVPWLLRYFGEVELFWKKLYRYELNGREYLSAFPKNKVTRAKNWLYTFSLIWEKRDDTYTKCHILVFPTQEQKELKKLWYLSEESYASEW